MRDHLLVAINGTLHRVCGDDAFLTLSDYVRERHALTGTKVVCAEGDCGACSVLVGRRRRGRFEYRVANSCILFLYQLDGAHVVTVEGLKQNGALNAVQRAMVDCFGSQCGFCTPGFVVAMTGLLEQCNGSGALSEDALRTGLSGNLCRCTGYVQIIEAGLAVDAAGVPRLNELYPDEQLDAMFAERNGSPALLETRRFAEQLRVFVPRTVEEACEFKGREEAVTVVSGATDIGVQHNKGRVDPRTVLCLACVDELEGVSIEDHVMIAGGRASWGDVESAVRDVLPEFYEVLLRFGSPQIRTSGTVGGNLANASPIADSIPLYMVTETELELVGAGGSRRVNINDFYLGYKKYDLRGDELIARVITPLPKADGGEVLRLYKVSRRKDLDISTFTAAIMMKLDGGTIEWARIAYGGVAPVVLRLRRTEEFVRGRELSEELMREAGQMAVEEIAPISDVRGSADYRMQLAANVLLKFYYETREHEESEKVL